MKKAVMLMAYGTPRSLEDVEAYYTHIRGGIRPSPEALENLVERYSAIGGTSPLMSITEVQRRKLESRLRHSGSETKVFSAMKHSPPFIADVVKEAAAAGVDQLLAIALAPHYSKISIGSYIKAVQDANISALGKMKLEFIPSWHDHPRLIETWARMVAEASKTTPEDYWLIFSAHSLPARILAEGDPYKDELRRTAELIAKKVGRTRWSFAFQSASHTHEPWLGPDILEHLDSLYAKGERAFLVAPIGFVSDHLEILYDIDVECKQWAKDRGARLDRTESLNDSDGFIQCLYELVVEKAFA
jgi:protoporphyrin/coproporphyrin ferrochelatase